jgi:gluconolactonase
MFAPPPIIDTEVFARLPDLPMREPNAWAAGQPRGMPAKSVLEGPSFDRHGNLFCVDIPNGRIFRVSPDGNVTLITEYDGWPNGLKIHRDGRIFVADFKNGIMLLDPSSGAVTPFLERAGLERFKAVNDLFFAANGDLYFTDQGLTGLTDPTGRVFRCAPDGEVTCLANVIPGPNGLVMNLEETALFVASTRMNCVWRLPLTRRGDVVKAGVFIQLSGGGGPDGLALTEEGGLAIAHVGLGSVWIFDSAGEPIFRVKSCAGRFTTNLAFGGTDRKTLFMTEGHSASILRATLPCAGKAMFSHA